jgi:3-methylcrotonyl-CoA carboxylase alpha subunit
VPVQAIVVRDGDMLHVFHGGGHWELGIYDPLAAAEAHEGASGGLTAPMPGKVAAVHVKAGQGVAAGQPLIVVEAMKMEHSIHAPAAGTVTEIRFKTGDQVQEGDVLVVVEEGTGADA